MTDANERTDDEQPESETEQRQSETDEERGSGAHEDETDEERAARIAREVGRHNPDPTTRREAIEQELAEEDLSEEGGELGQHNE